METGGEIIEFSVETERDRKGYNVKTKGNVTKNVSTAWRQKKKENKCASCTWIWSADNKCYNVTTEIYHSHK